MSKTPARGQIDDELLGFLSLLWAIDHGVQSTSKRMLASTGLTGPQRVVIRILGRSPDLSAGDLARRLHLHPSTLTGILRRLEERGLVTRRAHREDARRVILRLTDAGKRMDRPQSGTVEEVVASVLERLPRGELAVTLRVLEQLAGAFDTALEQGAPKARAGSS